MVKILFKMNMLNLAILTFCSVFSAVSANINITSPPITNWGDWGRFQRCPFGRYAQGFQLKTEANLGLFQDDTALNSIKLFCGDPYRPDTAVLTSTEGEFGKWGNIYSCYPGFLNGFQLRVEEYQGSGDDTATNNVRFYCTNLPTPNDYIEGDGLSYGSWGQTQHCYSNQVISGIQTQVEPNRGDDDDTSLNNVLMECSDYVKANVNEEERKIEEQAASLIAINPKFAHILTMFTKSCMLKYTLLTVAATANINITSPQVTNWGTWGRFQRCPFGRYAQAFQLKTEPNRLAGDDTALNAIRLFCGNPDRPDTAVIMSTEGQFGNWGKVFSCYPGFLNGFSLRAEDPQGSGDDTAANNIRLFCSNTPSYVEGDGLSFGNWSLDQLCLRDQAISGIQTQVEFSQGDEDDTALNNVLMECTNFPQANSKTLDK
ncbi:Vitelline membrane outer layer protein 1 [Orchesella cincta]|uniref:Vitelline membrane outer layer protein 1 n=1 Tax=Orchesella cincta TaxID=48709 RepID=A0A1D2MGX0_ORCCI|nr:Vitelline membrane outer layer protein 1 [Orchesella cincta]